MSKPKLKPCPFCGSSDLTLFCNIPGSTTLYNYVKCNPCKASSHSFPTKKEAVSAWNKRVYPVLKEAEKPAMKKAAKPAMEVAS